MGQFVVDPQHRLDWLGQRTRIRRRRVRKHQDGRRAMNAQQLLQEISDYCRQTGLAESTFAAARSMTASSRRGCATAGASPPIRSTASTASWRPPARAAPGHHRARPRAAPSRACASLGGAAPPAVRQSPATHSATSASSTTGKSTCSSSTPAARMGGGEPRLGELAHIHPRHRGARVRCRRRRRHVLVRVMRAMHDASRTCVLHGRQGDQP